MTGPPPVVVIGGDGAVGSMFTDLWRRDGCAVTSVDRLSGNDILHPSPEVEAAVRAADVVVLAVPEDVALAALAVVAPLPAPGAVLVDTLSVKSRFAAAVAQTPTAADVLGLNPMFAPSLGVEGRAVAAVHYRGGPGADAVLVDLARWGARVRELGADEHDRLCAALQALTHAAVLGFGGALAELGVDADAAAEWAPPPFTVLAAMLARITGGTAEVYRDVQASNPYAAEAREALARNVARLPVDDAGFAAALAAARVPLGAGAGRYGQLCADLFERVRP